MAKPANHKRLVEMCEAIMAKIPEGGYLKDKQEPWTDFVAEWSRERGDIVLRLGYYFEENGDDVYDPMVVIELAKTSISSMVHNEIVGTRLMDDDLQFTTAFVAEVFNRHFKRLDQPEYIQTAVRLGG